MYKPLADSTLMGMTKKEIIEQLRIAEHNYQAVKETVNQQAENLIKLLAEVRKHGRWIFDDDEGLKCSCCFLVDRDMNYYDYCPWCGAQMDEVMKK